MYRILGTLVLSLVATACTPQGPISGSYTLKGSTWPDTIAPGDYYTQVITVSADADAFAFDPDFDSNVKAKLSFEKSAFAKQIPLEINLYRDGTLVDSVFGTWPDLSFSQVYDLEDDESFTLCQVNQTCSFEYEVAIHNLATGDDDAIEVVTDIYADLWNLDNVYDSPDIDIQFH